MPSASGFLRVIACQQICSRVPLRAIACQQISTRMPPSRDFADAFLRDRFSAELLARTSVPKLPSCSAAQRRCCPPFELSTKSHQSQNAFSTQKLVARRQERQQLFEYSSHFTSLGCYR